MNIQDRALDLINQLQQAFFEQDMNRIIAVLDDEITWVGNDTQKIVQGLKQAEDMLLAEAETCKSLVFQNSWYRAMPVFEDTCLVYGVVEVQRKMPSMEMTDMQLRIFAICRLRDDKMLLSQFHVSPPEGNNQEETATDTDGTRETDGLLKEVSDKQCPGTNETNRVLKALIDIIPGGVQQRRFDSYLTILYLSDGFCTMSCC